MNAGRLSALIYTALSATFAGTFLSITLLTGDYSWVSRIGGAGWVFLLSMIILMPTITPWVKSRLMTDQRVAVSESGAPGKTGGRA